MKNILKLFVGLMLLLFWAQTFAAGSIAPKYYFSGFGTGPFWSIEIHGDVAFYSKSIFYDTAGVSGSNLHIWIYDSIQFTTTETEINFAGEHISGKIVEKECVDDSKWDTHNYEITVDGITWCADAEEDTKRIHAIWKDSHWYAYIKWKTLYYSDPNMYAGADINLTIEKMYNVDFYNRIDSIQFLWEGISGTIEEKVCEDDSKWDTHMYTVKITKNGNELIWCADGDISTLDIQELPPIWWDRDAHGCLLWAGYNWYPVKQECVRIFEVNLDSESYQKYLKTLDKAWAKWQKKVYNVMQKYKKIITKLSQEKQKNINKKVITKIDTLLKNKENTLLELLKFEIMQLD